MTHTASRLAILAGVLLLFGCATTPVKTNLTPANLQIDPSTSTYKDPSTDFTEFRTFSVFPFSLISKETKMNEIMEKQVLFFIRSHFEASGYIFVELKESPDFLVTADVASEYKEKYVPPQTITMPRLVPGRTITSHGTSFGNFNYNTYGSYSSYGYGSYSGISTTTTHLPGYVTTETYTRPGYTVGYHYPSASVEVFDAHTFKLIWTGTGVGTSRNPDVRVSCQLVLAKMISEFPSVPIQYICTPTEGAMGVKFAVVTVDGNNYFPTVLGLPEKGPAKKAGVKLYDMILSIDGHPVVNTPLSEVICRMMGASGSPARLELWRLGERIPITVTRIPYSQIY
jgi:hypothetical protein